jgi:hypothetical protein
MKLTKTKLKQMIKEELSSVRKRPVRRRVSLRESEVPVDALGKTDDVIAMVRKINELWDSNRLSDAARSMKEIGELLEDLSNMVGGEGMPMAASSERFFGDEPE